MKYQLSFVVSLGLYVETCSYRLLEFIHYCKLSLQLPINMISNLIVRLFLKSVLLIVIVEFSFNLIQFIEFNYKLYTFTTVQCQ